MIALLEEAKQSLESRFAPDGCNIGINVGEMAGQTVRHRHMHLIPRYCVDLALPCYLNCLRLVFVSRPIWKWNNGTNGSLPILA